MSTNDVPGANPANNDQLAMGCWAESADHDGSYILVESTENGRVIFLIFDTSRQRTIEFRDAMNEEAFKRRFSWNSSDKSTRWTWHDKTAFPWDVVIKRGARDGTRPAMAADMIEEAGEVADVLRDRVLGTGDDTAETAASRVAADLGLRGREVGSGETRALRRAFAQIAQGFQAAMDELRR